MEVKGLTKKEFAAKYRTGLPERVQSLYTDDDIIEIVLEEVPELASTIIQPEFNYSTYEPSFEDHLNQAVYNFSAMNLDIPAFATGLGAATIGNFVNYVTGDPELKNDLLNYSERLRKWSSDYMDDWMESDPGIQAYALWQQNEPLSLDNLFSINAAGRAMSSLAPSLATVLIPTGGVVKTLGLIGTSASKISKIAGYTSLGTMAALHGSGEYAEAMDYMVDSDEGPKMKPEEALPIAASQATVQAVLGAVTEKFALDKTAKALGIPNPIKTFATKPIADNLIRNFYGIKGNITPGILKNLTIKTGKVTEAAITGGTQEYLEVLLSNIQAKVREKYTGNKEEVNAKFANDLIDIVGNPNLKEGFYTGLVGTGVLGGLASIGGGAYRRLAKQKDKMMDDNIIADLGNDVDAFSVETTRPEFAVRAADIINKTNNSEKAIVDKIRSNETLANRIENSFDDVIEMGPKFFTDFDISPGQYINKIVEEKEYGINIDEDKFVDVINIATDAVKQINQTDIEIDTQDPIQVGFQDPTDITEGQIQKGKVVVDKKDKRKQEAKDVLDVDDAEFQKGKINFQKVNKAILPKDKKRIINKANMELNALAGLGQVKVIRHRTDPERIGDIEVPKGKRGQGIGTKVINNFKKIFTAEGKNKIKVVAKPGSEGFYRKQGFYSTGIANRKVKNPVTGEMQYPTLMELPLKRPDDKIIDNREMANEIATKLNKKFKWIKAKEVEQVFDRDGREVAGRAFNDIVEWSRTKGTLDTIPHEYAHIYTRVMKNSPIVKEGIKRFGSEEKLVQYIGEYYTKKMKDKTLISKIKTWLRKYVNELKKFFGAAMTDKDVANLISERFYSFQMKETDKKALKDNVMYQSVEETLSSSEGRSDNNMDNTLDNEGYIDDKEVSSKSDISTLINNVKTLINIPLTEQEDAMLRESARLKPFEEWRQTNLKQIFDKNNRDVFDLSQNDIDELKRFSIFVKNAIPINREDISDNGLVNVKAFRGSDFKYTFSLVKKNDIEYTARGYGFDKKQPQWATNLIAHQYPHLARLFEDMVSLGKEKLYIGNRSGKFFKSRFFLADKALNYFTKNSITIKGTKDRYIPMFSRGDRPKMFFGKIKDSHTKISKNAKLYKQTIQGLKDKGYFKNNSVFKHVFNLTVDRNKEEFLATFDYINQIIPGWTNLKFEEVLKRIKIPLTPAFTSPDTPDANVKFIKAENIKYKFKDTINKNGKIVQGLKFNMSDGDTMTSRSYVKKVAEIFGLNRNVGWLKSVIYDIQNVKSPLTYNKDIEIVYETSTKTRKSEDALADDIVPAYMRTFKDGTQKIFIDRKELRNKFNQKAWTKPKVKGVKPLPANQFKSYEEFERFVIEHEKAHTKIFRNEGESLGNYENRINDAALNLITDGNITNNLDNIDLLMVKHQHSIPEDGVEIYDGNSLVAVVKNGEIQSPDGSQTYDMIMTDDEAKIRNGKYSDNVISKQDNVFTVPGSSFGLIKMTKAKPRDVSYPLQWMNHVKDFGLIRKLIDSYTGENSKSYKILAGLMTLTNKPEGISKFADRLKERFPTEINNAVYENSKLGGGLHVANSKILDILAKSNVVLPAFKLGGQPGSILYMQPNYRGDLAENEIAVDRDLMIRLIPAFKKSTTIEAMNDYLAKNDFRLLGYRTPVAYIGGANYVRVKRVHDIEGTVQLHPSMVARNMEGDYDGDTFAVLKVPNELDKPLKDYFNSAEYTKNIKSLDLSKYVSKTNINPGKFLDRNSIIDAMLYSENAVQDVAALQSIYGLFKNNFNYVPANFGGSISRYGIEAVKGQIDLGFLKGTADEILRTYLQAAVDNPKYLLLKKWGYDKKKLIAKIFKFTDFPIPAFEGTKAASKVDIAFESVLDNFINYYLDSFSTLRKIKSGVIGKDTAELIEYSNRYKAWKNALSYSEIYSSGMTRDQSLMEAAVSSLGDVYDKFIVQDPETADSRKSPFLFPKHSHSNAHITALKNLKVQESLNILRDAGFGKSIKFIDNILNETKKALTTKKGNLRPIQPKSWEANEGLIKIIYKLEDNKATNKAELKAMTYAMLNNIDLNALETMPPSRYFDQNIMKQYYKEYTNKLTENISDDTIMNTEFKNFKKGRC